MLDAITDVQGIAVGHAQDASALTGCTVVLAERGATAGVDVRGLAPGTRETDLCRPGTLVEQAQAVLLSGGSAFGLDAATGVMRYLHERDLGFETGVVRVPIVPAAVIFDLGIGDVAWPDAEMGYRACAAASAGSVDQGNVGAGTGATVGKLLGPASAMKSGLGTASRRVGDVTVGALMVVNALGNVLDPAMGSFVAGGRAPGSDEIVAPEGALLGAATATNTTIGVVATDAVLTSLEAQRLARAAQDGLARTIKPVHTLYDGDAVFALATAERPSGDLSAVALHLAALDVVERAILNAIRYARSAGGLPAAGDLGTLPLPDDQHVGSEILKGR